MVSNEHADKLISFISSHIAMTEEEIHFLRQTFTYKKFKKKEIIHQQGDVQRYMAFILEGAVRFYFTDKNGIEDTFEFVFENVPIGNYKTLVQEEKAPASVQAMENTALLAISKTDFLAFMTKYPKYYMVSTELMGKALQDSPKREKLLNISSSSERYNEFARQQPDAIKRVPLSHIASYLNMALGTLSRVRAGKL